MRCSVALSMPPVVPEGELKVRVLCQVCRAVLCIELECHGPQDGEQIRARYQVIQLELKVCIMEVVL